MYNIYVPTIGGQVDRMGREELLKNLKQLDCDEVFCALGSPMTDPQEFQECLESLKKDIPYFKKEGLSVGIWSSSFTLRPEEQMPFTYVCGPDGKTSSIQVCPSDEGFTAFWASYVQALAKTGADMILLDDDYRYSFGVGLCCACKNHRRKMEEILHESLEGKDLATPLMSGKPNKYRNAYIEADGYYLKEFARKLRAAVDEVNPNIRIGVCCATTNWDLDGAPADELCKLLAGNTKPFLRLSGAPYWTLNTQWGGGNRVQNVVELTRMQISWVKDKNIEIVAEGDTYPRPRHTCPASYLSMFDSACRADGTADGILYYALDYVSKADYENGYIRAHQKDKASLAFIDRYFSDKQAVGVRVYERMQKYADMTPNEAVAGTDKIKKYFYSFSSRLLVDNSIPTVYDTLGVAGIAFNVNASLLTEEAMRQGVILDLPAAEFLTKQGIDVGLESIGEKYRFASERFAVDNQIVLGFADAYKIHLKPGAKIESIAAPGYHQIKESADYGKTDEIISYTYQNADGQKFLVFAFDGYFTEETAFRNYARSRQIERVIREFFGKKLPAYCCGNPDLYILAKKSEKAMAVGLWNFFADGVENAVVELDEAYQEIEFVNCTGSLQGDKVIIDSMQPFSFAGIHLTKA